MTGKVIRMSVRSRRSRVRKGILPVLLVVLVLRGTWSFAAAVATAAVGSSTAAA